MTPRLISIDYETRSPVDLTVAGVARYCESPDTDVYCMAWEQSDGSVAVWEREDLFLPAEIETALAEGAYLRAWNASFERTIWNSIMVPRYGWPALPPERFVCTMALAASASLPLSLDKAAIALGLRQHKDLEGHKLMRRMCKPREFIVDDKTGKTSYKWWDDPERRARLSQYCAQDVRTEMEAWSKLPPSMNARERAIWLMDQRINDRGLALDLPLVRAGYDLVQAAQPRIAAAIAEITGGISVTQVAKLKEWLAAQGVVTASLDKARLAELLTEDKVSLDVRRVLEARRDGAKSSTAKFAAMLAAVCADGRIRGSMQYYGATTGRWAGRGIQPHNFPKPSRKITPDILEDIRGGDLDVIEMLHGPVLPLLADALRSCFVPGAGARLAVADYSSIEARIVAWLAGEEDLVEAFRRGEKIYEGFAGVIYGVDPATITPDDPRRQHGKIGVLGCLAGETPVLTPRGYVPLQSLTLADKLWDGIEWVSHEGVIWQGEKDAIEWGGISLTGDHRVLCAGRWRPWEGVVRNGVSRFRSSALSSGNLPCGVFGSEIAGAFGRCGCAVPAGVGNTTWTCTTCERARQHGARPARREKLRIRGKLGGVTGMSVPTTSTAPDSSTASPPRVNAALIPEMPRGHITGAVGFPLASRTAELFWRTFLRWWGGINRRWKWIASTWTVIMCRGTSASSLDNRTSITADPWLPSSRKCSTFDVLCAGPRRRFTIWSAVGPILVHNCGFGMAGQRASEQYGIDRKLANFIVQTYRSTYSRIVDLWRNMNQSANQAVLGRGEVVVPNTEGKLRFEATGGYLLLHLPSGRALWYHAPQVRTYMVTRTVMIADPITGEDHEEDRSFEATGVECSTLNALTKQWTRQQYYGGLWTENATQACARDIMADAMLRCEASPGIEVILSVHDEIVAEVQQGITVRAFVDLLTTIPPWAAGCPIAAEGWIEERYRK